MEAAFALSISGDCVRYEFPMTSALYVEEDIQAIKSWDRCALASFELDTNRLQFRVSGTSSSSSRRFPWRLPLVSTSTRQHVSVSSSRLARCGETGYGRGGTDRAFAGVPEHRLLPTLSKMIISRTMLLPDGYPLTAVESWFNDHGQRLARHCFGTELLALTEFSRRSPYLKARKRLETLKIAYVSGDRLHLRAEFRENLWHAFTGG